MGWLVKNERDLHGICSYDKLKFLNRRKFPQEDTKETTQNTHMDTKIKIDLNYSDFRGEFHWQR